MAELKGMAYLKRILSSKRNRAELRYDFYEMKYKIKPVRRGEDPDFKFYKFVLGWCTKAVDALADRLVFNGFKESQDYFNLNGIFAANNKDVFFDSAILSALITSCSFVYIHAGADGFPVLEVIDGRDATGIVDPVTNMLEEGYAVLDRDEKGKPTIEAYFTPDYTEFIYANRDEPERIENPAPYPLLVPIIYRPDAKRPLGHSRISRTNMDLIQAAVRTVKRSEISAEFYSFPQKYVTGLAQDSEQMDKWKATMSTMLTFTKDDEGDKPTLGQFQQQTMTPYIEQLKCFAALFAGENGLTLDDLGFVSDNPSSAEAIKASHETLRLTARKAQRTFGSCFVNVGYLAACVRDYFAYRRAQVLAMAEPEWAPIFEPDGAAIGLIGDGAIKVNQAVPGYFNKDNLEPLIGIGPSEIDVPEPQEGEDVNAK